jgi:hypothetical protein
MMIVLYCFTKYWLLLHIALLHIVLSAGGRGTTLGTIIDTLWRLVEEESRPIVDDDPLPFVQCECVCAILRCSARQARGSHWFTVRLNSID